MNSSHRIGRAAVPALRVGGLALVMAASGCAVLRVSRAIDAARRSEALQSHPADPTLRMLIVGDSTAMGTGASAAGHSLAGLLARDYPRLWIDNRARNGAGFDAVQSQLRAAGRYDIVLVQAGGNDVLRLRGRRLLQSAIESTVRLARQRAGPRGRVVLMPAGNLGNAPIFFPPLGALMSSRSRLLHALVREAAEDLGADYVNLFHESADDPFAADRELVADDGLHPSDAGYRVWQRELLAQGAPGVAGGLAGVLALAL